MARRRQRNAPRDYPRTARLNELLREVIADEIEQLDDDRLGLVTVTAVEVDTELTLAKVFVSSLDDDADEVVAILAADHRGAIRKAIGLEARLRRTPDLIFTADASVAIGGRIEEVLREIQIADADRPTPSAETAAEPPAADDQS